VFPRIATDPAILGGKPCIKGTRLSVEFILELIAGNATHDDIVRAYPKLTHADVQQAVLYASRVLRTDTVIERRIAG
jgi:uncharacterized protein (DUF433 family)